MFPLCKKAFPVSNAMFSWCQSSFPGFLTVLPGFQKVFYLDAKEYILHAMNPFMDDTARVSRVSDSVPWVTESIFWVPGR